jgi:putative resolvase
MTRTYSLGEFARLMGVHPKTVQRWDRDGTLTAKRTPTGRRFYTDENRRRVLGFPEAQKRSIAYCRVSSAAQKPDLKKQRQALEQFCISGGIAQVEFLEEVGGGMNFERKVFTELMDAVGRGEISKLIVAHKDRLVRFGFAWFSHFCEINGCELLVLNAETLSPQAETRKRSIFAKPVASLASPTIGHWRSGSVNTRQVKGRQPISSRSNGTRSAEANSRSPWR